MRRQEFIHIGKVKRETFSVIYGPRSHARANEFWGGWGIDTVAVIYAACEVRALEGLAAMKGIRALSA